MLSTLKRANKPPLSERYFNKRSMQLKLYAMLLLLALICFAPQPSSGSEIAWWSIGLRGGINDHRNEEDFKQYEGFSTWKLPWFLQWDSGWTLGTYLEANAGILRGGGESAFVGSIGPGIYFTGFKERVEISMGINPTIISKHKFGDENLGGPIEFTSHIGLAVNFTRHLAIGYRLQHMSNAVLYEHNPGLNLHMIEVSYRF
jgi:hypothetical protein